MNTTRLIVGLGNPGSKYEATRHNIGFRILDQLRENLEHSSWQESTKFEALISRAEHDGVDLILVKPQTFMNLSGKSVAALVNYYKIDPTQDVLTCYDDKDLLFGKLRERREGGSGGHNGIKSLIAGLGTEEFHRLKFGIGHEEQRIPTDAFVLQKFSSEEEQELPELIDKAVVSIQDWLNSS